MKTFFTKLWTHIKEWVFAFFHFLSLGLVQFWRDTADERKTFWANLKANLTQSTKKTATEVVADAKDVAKPVIDKVKETIDPTAK